MRFIADYIMRGRMQAALVTGLCAVLSLLLPPLTSPLSYLSGGAVGLVTLRQGPRQGVVVLVAAAFALGVLSWLVVGSPLLAMVFALVVWVPVWLAALVLYRTVDLGRAVQIAGLVGAVLVVGVHLAVADPAAWWTAVLESLPGVSGQAGGPEVGFGENVEQAAALMTGMLATALVLSVVASLFVARWWQALLYNPGGFRDEFHTLRLGKNLAFATVAIMAVATLASGPAGAVAADLLWIAVVLHLLQGLAVMHGLLAQRQAHVGWLVGLYVVLLFTFPIGVIMVAGFGLADSWMDFRRSMGKAAE